MIALFEAALELQQVLVSKKRRFAFIGGIAVQRWGEPRVTQDLDLTVFTGVSKELELVNDLLTHYVSS